MKEYTLNKDGFHAKLQMYIFGHIPYEDNFCPYFWLTVFCIIVFIPVFLFKLINKILLVPYKMLDKFLTFFEEKYCIPKLEKVLDGMPRWQIYDMFRLYDRGSLRTKTREYKLIDHWVHIKSHEEIKAFMDKYREDWLEQQRIVEAKEELREARKKRVHLYIIKYTKWLAPVVLLAVIGGFSFGGYKLFFLLDDWLGWDAILSGMGILTTGAVFLLLLCGLFHLAKKFFGRTVCFICRPFKLLGIPFVFMGKAIGSVFSFFYLFFKTFKDDHCPSIRWEQ
jgi:hypothetical protein